MLISHAVLVVLLLFLSPTDARDVTILGTLMSNMVRWQIAVLAVVLLPIDVMLFRQLQRDTGRAVWRGVVLATLVLTVIAVVAGPRFSADSVSYYGTGKIARDTGANLYVTPPSELSHPDVSLIGWQTTTYFYGPLWLAISRGVVVAGFPTGVVIFSFFGGLGFLAGLSLLLVSITAKQRPILALFALHPMLITEMIANAHTEWAFFLSGCTMLFLLLRGKDIFSGVMVAVAVMIKPIGIFLAPLVVAERSSRRALSLRIVLLCGSLALFLVPLWKDFITAGAKVASLVGVTNLAPLPFIMKGIGFTTDTVRFVSLIVMLLGAAIALRSILRAHRPEESFRALFFLLTLFLLTFGLYQQPWYLLWLFPWVLFAPRAHLWLIGLTLVWAASYVHLGWVWLIGFSLLWAVVRRFDISAVQE